MAITAEAIDEPAKKPSLVDDAYGKLKDAIRENEFPLDYQGSERKTAIGLGRSGRQDTEA